MALISAIKISWNVYNVKKTMVVFIRKKFYIKKKFNFYKRYFYLIQSNHVNDLIVIRKLFLAVQCNLDMLSFAFYNTLYLQTLQCFYSTCSVALTGLCSGAF